MKKLLIILAAILTLSANSQVTNSSGTVSALSIAQNSVCVCDSVNVSFRYRCQLPLSAPVDFTLHAQVNSVYRTMALLNYNKIFKMSKVPVGNIYNDTTYSFKCPISCNSLAPSGINAIFSFTFKDAIIIPVLVKNCMDAVGIEEHSADEEVVIFYNFSGQIVEPKQGDLLIKQVGKTRIKVLIQ